jgi:hypothetical protein
MLMITLLNSRSIIPLTDTPSQLSSSWPPAYK